MSRGRKRKFNPNIPEHIDQDKLPGNCYWDNSYSGHWYTTFKSAAGKPRRRKIADPDALLSELHRIMELENGIDRDTFEFIANKYFESDSYIQLKNKKNHLASYKTICNYQTKIRKKLNKIPIKLWDDALVQQLIDRIGKRNGATVARLLNAFIRRVFQWNLKRGFCSHNPALRTELPNERKKQIYPSHKAYSSLLQHAIKNGTYGAKKSGSCPHYIWMIMELEYLCRQRGAECRTLTDAHISDDGVLTERLKGSRDNITIWNDRLKHVVNEAQKARDVIYRKKGIGIPLKPINRPLIVNTMGEPLKAEAYQSAWQRFITNSIKLGVIDQSKRFSLHDLKRKGITDTDGSISEKLESSGHVEAKMLKIYDKSIPKVKPSND